MSSAAIVEQQRPGQRSWRDLSKWRLFLGLAFAPAPPIALGALILLIFGAGVAFVPLGSILASAETWSMPIGTLFLAVARFRGVVRRAHCLLLGAFLACSLPAAAYLVSQAVDSGSSVDPVNVSDDDFDGSFHGPSDGTFVVILGLFLIPFGTLGGWIFWRVGVYPAQPKVIDVGTVFD